MLIKNYGLFWRRDNIFWGKQNNSGRFDGYIAGTAPKKESSIDFRRQHGIYVLYDENFSLVYVGQAGSGHKDLFDRLKNHTKDHLANRWSLVSWFGIRKVKITTGDLAESPAQRIAERAIILNQIEAILISSAEPPLNRQGGRFGDDVDQYLQFVDVNDLGLSETQMLRDLHEDLISRS